MLVVLSFVLSSTEGLDDNDVCTLQHLGSVPLVAWYHSVVHGQRHAFCRQAELFGKLLDVECRCLCLLVVDVHFHALHSFYEAVGMLLLVTVSGLTKNMTEWLGKTDKNAEAPIPCPKCNGVGASLYMYTSCIIMCISCCWL